MKILIRDDDPCYFTKVEELEKCYRNFYQEVPICLSITPFRVAGKYFASNNPELEHPLGDNQVLTQYLKEKLKEGQLDVALHGYSHVYYNDVNRNDRIPEYAVNHGLYEKTAKGKAYLEDLLDHKVNTFVPPSNKISKHGIQAIVHSGLNLMKIPGFRPSQRPVRLSNFLNYHKLQGWKKKQKAIAYPYPLVFKDHIEMESNRLYPSTDLNQLINYMKTVADLDGHFVIATHYHAFDKKIKSGETIEYAFSKLIETAYNLNNTEFITYRDLWPR